MHFNASSSWSSYSSYGSYGSLTYRPATAMEIQPNNRVDDTCAYPSWPRRDSLSDSDSSSSRSTAFLSDDELSFGLDNEDPFFDDCDASVGSRQSLEHQLERERLQQQQEAYVRQMVAEKEKERRRKQQALRQAQLAPRRSNSPKKHTKSKLSS